MALISLTERSIFFRIYTGLLLVCVCVGFFAYFLVDTLNQERVQSYREKIATGVFYVVGQEIAKQKTPEARQLRLSDASNLFGHSFSVVPIASVDLKTREWRLLEEEKTVVRYLATSNEYVIFHRISGEDNLLTVKMSQIGERHLRALTIFVLDDLAYYPSIREQQARLEFLSQKFSYKIALTNFGNIELDQDQIARLRRGEPVLMFDNDNGLQNSKISIVAASNVEDVAMVIGPIELFNWAPFNLMVSVALTCMLLIGLGVYGLIFPLERRLRLLQIGVNRVSSGKLDTKVQVIGQDDIARLSMTFNAMTAHIKRLIEAQRELTRAVSHELRTPVARIRFAVDMLADTDDGESRQLQKNYIDEDIESLNELIDEILTYAKLEEGSPKLDWEMVDLRELIEQIERETNALGKPIKILTDLPSLKVAAMADRRYLHRVVQNLVGNAIRYADASVKVSAGILKDTAYVCVEDDGQGIAEADREKVFVPFARLDDSRTRASGGYGLGLSIVSRIAFWFNAELSVDESPTLGGARFMMRWPIKQVGVVIVADELTQQKAEKTLM
ncbi:ATP-binding protein [Moraxella sp.]|uniref:ATP-binding protein n=1 Tax=Moraxella sp. TaxID=479 RepID=UPI0026DBD892|nr:ATP-binding protein [Moraxella sp.]MDO4894931.1 ATP-binding protein [Moraxella sp.]